MRRKYSAIATAIRLAVALSVLVSCAAQPVPSNQQTAPAPSLPSATPDTYESVVTSPTPTDALLNDTDTTLAPTDTSPNAFVETFDGNPAAPQPWHPTNWEVTVHSRDVDTWSTLEPMRALHGSDCSGPPATHEISAYEDAVFLCRDHLMTAINANGYGLIYFTPNQLVDFSTSEAVIRWDMSTLRTSGRDWVDLWITPFADNQELPLEDWLPDLSGPPRNAIHILMASQGDDTIWKAEIYENFVATEVASNWWTGWRTFLTESPTRRDTFELRIGQDHLKFGMPAYNFDWIDTRIEHQNWGQGVVQFGHHSYNPTKSDSCGSVCQPNTWHWDNVSISPAVSFTLLRADRRTVDAAHSQVVFPAASPANAHLRFAGVGNNLRVSFDEGITWQPAMTQSQAKNIGEPFRSYWMPIPAGISSVQIRGDDSGSSPWLVRDISIWALAS